MRCYVTVLDDDAGLVPFFVRHYGRLGATSFPVTVWGTRKCLDETVDVIRRLGFRSKPLGVFEAESFCARERERFIASQHNDDWAFFCDIDEFAELTPLQVQAFKKYREPYIGGWWIDRVAEGGKLQDVVVDRPLESQFPNVVQARRLFGQRMPPVYVFSKQAPLFHHPHRCSWGKRHWPSRTIIRVHHFKWQRNVIDRLTRRIHRDRNRDDRKAISRVNRKTLRYLERHDGFDPETLEYLGDIRLLDI